VLATAGRGKVLVVDGGGSQRCALMGDLIARSAVDNGWEGVVIYGCIRDRVALRDLALASRRWLQSRVNRREEAKGRSNCRSRLRGCLSSWRSIGCR